MIREILSFGAVALGGGYLAKRYWDKKKAENILSEHYMQQNAFNRLQRFNHLREKIRLSLINIAEKIKHLGDFGDSLKLFHFDLMSDAVYDLFIMSKDEARIMIERLGEICEALKDKEIWLDEITQSLGESLESKSHESLPTRTKSEITALINIMQSIYMLVLWSDLVRDNKWRDDKLTEAQNALVALKSHPSGGQ